MVVRVATVAFEGLDARPVDVQVLIGGGMNAFTIVGLADKAVGESRERVRGALLASGLALPAKRITVNLAPADLPKEGSHYDLPIALGLMAALGAIPPESIAGACVLGELALDGSITGVAGALPAAMAANGRGQGLICPAANGPEAAWASESQEIVAAESLIQLANHLAGNQPLARPRAGVRRTDPGTLPDLADIKGQESAKRALEVAAAGAHNLLFCGPPGSGKSMLAQRLPSILPPLEPKALLDVSMIHSIAGASDGGLSEARPFRAPHHSASMAALVGGGLKVRPGEVSLAHEGVLFLDELPEFDARTLDALRQPLESGEAVIARANHRVTYPARFQLVAAMNPCRCGMAGEPGHTCRRGARCAADYQAKVSGPMLDRIDIHMDVPAVSAMDLLLPAPSEGSAEVAARVAAAREIQARRYAAIDLTGHTNASVPARTVEEVARPDAEGVALMQRAAEQMRLSARGYHRVLRVARTLADLDAARTVGRVHIAEALSYRARMDRDPARAAPALASA